MSKQIRISQSVMEGSGAYNQHARHQTAAAWAAGQFLERAARNLAIDKWRAVAAFVIVTLSFLRKLRTEEAFMRAQFGAAYDAYRAEVPALVPRLWARSD